MTFDLIAILVFAIAAVIYAALIPPKGRGWFLFAGSALAIFWLQPALPIRFSDSILPTATLVLTVISWWFTRNASEEVKSSSKREDRLSLIIIAMVVIGLALFRYLGAEYRLTPSRPPSPISLAIALLLIGGAFAGLFWLINRRSAGDPPNEQSSIS